MTCDTCGKALELYYVIWPMSQRKTCMECPEYPNTAPSTAVELTQEVYNNDGWEDRPALTIRDVWQALRAIEQREGNMPLECLYDCACARTSIHGIFVRHQEESDIPDDPENPDVTMCLLLG